MLHLVFEIQKSLDKTRVSSSRGSLRITRQRYITVIPIDMHVVNNDEARIIKNLCNAVM